MRDMDNISLEIVVLTVIALFMALAIFGVDFARCKARTWNIGFESRYNPFSGCVIEIAPNQWVPLENYRFMGE